MVILAYERKLDHPLDIFKLYAHFKIFYENMPNRFKQNPFYNMPWQCLNFLPDPHGQGALRGVLSDMALAAAARFEAAFFAGVSGSTGAVDAAD